MGNCACCEGPGDKSTSSRKPRFDGRKFSSANEIWIKELTKKLIIEIIDEAVGPPGDSYYETIGVDQKIPKKRKISLDENRKKLQQI